ncbi:MAG: ABC transporter, permease protein 1 (cluster 1, maltose/g3p/polyamine/iron), partial [uncultured Frankineae bacterium]
ALPALRRRVPALPHPGGGGRRLRRQRGGAHARQRPDGRDGAVPRRLRPQPAAVGPHRRHRGGARRPARLGRRHRQAGRSAAPRRHLGGRGAGAVRRGDARLRLPRHGGLRGSGHRVAARPRSRHLRGRGVDLRAVGAGPGLHLLPGAAHGHRLPAGARRPQAAVAGGCAQPGRDELDLLAPRRRAGARPGLPRLDAAAVRQRLLRLRHRRGAGLPGSADRAPADPGAADQRGDHRAAEPRAGPGSGHGARRHRRDAAVRAAAAPYDAVAAV